MCTIALAFHAHPDYPLILASNRDEAYARPSKPAGFWDDQPDLIAGRDLRGGGTWLGITRTGRFAMLTNVRHGARERPDAPSRGGLVTDYLLGDESPAVHASRLSEEAHQYNGFNLIMGDPHELILFSNRADAPISVGSGVYGISNAVPGELWPKAERAKTLLATVIEEERVSTEALMELLADDKQTEDALLPDTGVVTEWARVLSPIFIRTEKFGTVASTAIIVDKHGRAQFAERQFGSPGKLPKGEEHFEFEIPAFASNETHS